jgi:hypothetical protein
MEAAMKRHFLPMAGAALALLIAATMPQDARAEAELDCKLTFSLTGWSAIYKHAEGSGVVHCQNGETMNVNIEVKGGGLTAGKWHIDDGKGEFSDVYTISDVLGSYAQGEAQAGVVKSATAQVLTKGTVSLALAGTGEGINLGVSVGSFKLTRAD